MRSFLRERGSGAGTAAGGTTLSAQLSGLHRICTKSDLEVMHPPIQGSAVVDRFSVIRKPNMVTDDAVSLRSAHSPETDMRMCKSPTRCVLQREPMRVLRIAIYCEGLHHCWWPR